MISASEVGSVLGTPGVLKKAIQEEFDPNKESREEFQEKLKRMATELERGDARLPEVELVKLVRKADYIAQISSLGLEEAKRELKSFLQDVLLAPEGRYSEMEYNARIQAVMALLRDRGIEMEDPDDRDNALPHDFDFANYLATAMGLILAEMVELPLYTWLGLEVLVLIFYALQALCPPVVLLWVWILFGISLVYTLALLLDRIQWIRSQLIAQST